MSSTYRNDLRGAYRLREGGGGVFSGFSKVCTV